MEILSGSARWCNLIGESILVIMSQHKTSSSTHYWRYCTTSCESGLEVKTESFIVSTDSTGSLDMSLYPVLIWCVEYCETSARLWISLMMEGSLYGQSIKYFWMKDCWNVSMTLNTLAKLKQNGEQQYETDTVKPYTLACVSFVAWQAYCIHENFSF